MGVLLQRSMIYNSQPYVNTFISALMNWFPRFERKRLAFSVLRSEKSYFPTREREMRLGLNIFTTFCSRGDTSLSLQRATLLNPQCAIIITM